MCVYIQGIPCIQMGISRGLRCMLQAFRNAFDLHDLSVDSALEPFVNLSLNAALI